MAMQPQAGAAAFDVTVKGRESAVDPSFLNASAQRRRMRQKDVRRAQQKKLACDLPVHELIRTGTILASPAESGDAQIRDLDYTAMDIDDTGNVLFIVIPRYADDRNSAPPPENLLNDAGRYIAERNDEIEFVARLQGQYEFAGGMHISDRENPPW